MLMMVLFKNVVWVGMDNHHPIYIMHVREEGTAKNCPKNTDKRMTPNKFLIFLDIISLY